MTGKLLYPKIFLLSYKPKSGCKYFEARESEGMYYAYCKVLERPLQRTVVEKCERFWETCPFRRMAARMEEGEL